MKTTRMTQKESQKRIFKKILKYGQPVLTSDAFRAAYAEVHHLKGNLADHILNVTIMGCLLCEKEQQHQRAVKEEQVVLACLCHDLGMTGRDTLYRDRLSAWREHAEESVRRARAILPDLDQTTADAIKTHMWPVSGRPPRTREGRIVLMADKIASAIDWFSFVQHKPWQPKIKERVEVFVKTACL